MAPISAATVVSAEGGLSVSLDATDDVGVAGVEYRSNLGLWQRYAGLLFLATGDNIRFRAVEVNGSAFVDQLRSEATNRLLDLPNLLQRFHLKGEVVQAGPRAS